MKKLSMLFVIFAAFFMFVACDNNLKFTPEGGNIDSGDTSDHSDTSDTSDTSDPTTEQPDSGDSQSDDDTDTATEDDSDTIPDDDSDTDTGTTPTENAKEACNDIYQCFSQCQDSTCAQACFDNGDPAGQEVFMAMYTCWSNNCANEQTNEGFKNCVVANCKAETEACGLIDDSHQSDTSYNSPYGSATLNFSTQYIYVDQNDQSQDGFIMSPFADGSIGNTGSFSLAPADAYANVSYAMSMNGMVGVVQMPYYSDNNHGTLAVQLVFKASDLAIGSATVGITDADLGQMFVYDEENGHECMHAIAMGDISISTLKNVTVGGAGSALAFTGNVTFYSPKNVPEYGDITGAFSQPVVACSPK